LEELVNAARQFENDAPPLEEGENLSKLDHFLAHAALESGETQGETGEDCVQLMTLHSAKGLEFDLVFLVGLEEGLFPSMQSLEEAGRLEEERRLCYVGITRARQQLYITHAESRRLYGKETYPRSSRFLREIPPEHLQEIRMKANITRPAAGLASPQKTPLDAASRHGGFKLGQHVTHAKFGEGVILQFEGEGPKAVAQVNFTQAGTKWLVLAMANLQAV
jgi:DNA helicase-2/ATP-dependent DNA helicase PcrA